MIPTFNTSVSNARIHARNSSPKFSSHQEKDSKSGAGPNSAYHIAPPAGFLSLAPVTSANFVNEADRGKPQQKPSAGEEKKEGGKKSGDLSLNA